MKNLVNECFEQTDNCSPNALCTDKMVGYTCKCNNGYNGDGETCEEVDLEGGCPLLVFKNMRCYFCTRV